MVMHLDLRDRMTKEKYVELLFPLFPIEWLNMQENAFIERSNQDSKGYFLDSFQNSLLRQMCFTQALGTLTEPFETNENLFYIFQKMKATNSVSFKALKGLGTIK